MKLKWAKPIVSLGLAAMLLGAGTASSTGGAGRITDDSAQSGAAATFLGGKQEVVYANLATDGGVQNIYVVNQFDVEDAGMLTDYGSYSAVKNLTSTAALAQDGDKVTVPVEPGNFYYQGTLVSTDLPWNFDMSYTLDGAALDADVVAGKSGDLAIHLNTSQNTAVDATFYDNYMLQITFTLNADKCTNIASSGASIANAGKNKVIAHTVMPGKDADITLTATVTDFEMGGVEIAAVPFTMPIEMPDTSTMTDEMSSLVSAIDQLDSGIGQMAGGTANLASGAAQLASGSNQYQDGLNQLNGGSAQLVEGSEQIQKALKKIASAISGAGGGLDPSALAQLPQALNDLSGGLVQISAALVQLRDGFAQGYAALDTAIAQLSPVAQADIDAMAAALAEAAAAGVDTTAAQAALGNVQLHNGQVMLLLGTYYGPNGNDGAKAAFDAVGPAIDALTDPASPTSLNGLAGALSLMATQIGEALQSMDLSGLQQLAEGLTKLSKEYGKFQEGLVQYTGGVASVASGYGALNGGIAELASGAAQLNNGAGKLRSGSSELAGAVADLPDEMQAQIDELMDEYNKPDFAPVSFVSPKNTDVDYVQFVFMTEAIAKQAPPAEETTPQTDPSLWDRITSLFG